MISTFSRQCVPCFQCSECHNSIGELFRINGAIDQATVNFGSAFSFRITNPFLLNFFNFVETAQSLLPGFGICNNGSGGLTNPCLSRLCDTGLTPPMTLLSSSTGWTPTTSGTGGADGITRCESKMTTGGDTLTFSGQGVRDQTAAGNCRVTLTTEHSRICGSACLGSTPICNPCSSTLNYSTWEGTYSYTGEIWSMYGQTIDTVQVRIQTLTTNAEDCSGVRQPTYAPQMRVGLSYIHRQQSAIGFFGTLTPSGSWVGGRDSASASCAACHAAFLNSILTRNPVTYTKPNPFNPCTATNFGAGGLCPIATVTQTLWSPWRTLTNCAAIETPFTVTSAFPIYRLNQSADVASLVRRNFKNTIQICDANILAPCAFAEDAPTPPGSGSFSLVDVIREAEAVVPITVTLRLANAQLRV